MKNPTRISTLFSNALEADHELTPKQRQIIRAALELFAINGFENTTTNEIATRAGVAEGTVYKRYTTKRELLQTILDRFMHDVLPQAAAEFTAEGEQLSALSMHDLFTTLISNRLAFIQDNYLIIKIVVSQALTDDALRKQAVDVVGTRLLGAFVPHLHRFKSSGVMVNWPDDVIFQFILGIVGSMAVRLFMKLPDFDMREQTQYMVTLIEKGLAAN